MGTSTRNIAMTIHMSHSSHVGLRNFLIWLPPQRPRWVLRVSFRLEPLELSESPKEHDSANREYQGQWSPHLGHLGIDERHIPEVVNRSADEPSGEIDCPSGPTQERDISIECFRRGHRP